MFSDFCNYVKVLIGFDLCREGGGGGASKGRYGCVGPSIKVAILRVNFCLGIWFWEVNFAWALGFWQFLTKCVIFDKK